MMDERERARWEARRDGVVHTTDTALRVGNAAWTFFVYFFWAVVTIVMTIAFFGEPTVWGFIILIVLYGFWWWGAYSMVQRRNHLRNRWENNRQVARNYDENGYLREVPPAHAPE